MRRVSIMRQVRIAISISVIILCAILRVRTAHAGPLYTTTVPFFSDGLDVETGTKHTDPTVLIVVCGPEDAIEEVLKPTVANLVDFSLYPAIDLHFEYEPGAVEPIVIAPEVLLQTAIVDQTFDFTNIDTLAFQPIDAGNFLEINPENILVFKTAPLDIFTMAFSPLGGLEVEVSVGRLDVESPVVPEPASLLLFCLGLLGVVGVVKWRRKWKSSLRGSILLFLLMSGTVFTAKVSAQELLHPLITLRKAGTGTGTILAGDDTCDSWCPEMSVPYSEKTAIILKVIPDPNSLFVRWEKADGSSSTGKVHVQPGDTITAVFEKKDGPAMPEYVEKQVLVKLHPDADVASILNLKTQVGVTEVEALDDLGVERWKISVSVEEALQMLRDSPAIAYIEPNYIVTLDATIPNDPAFSRLWGLQNAGQFGGTVDADIDAPEAWDIQTGGHVVVAVIDTGVDYTHPDLAANMWKNPGEIPNNGKDDDGNGYVDDVYGYDFANNDDNPFDDHDHGTHCAGTIAGVGNNGTGVVGVNWSAKIMALKFLRSDGRGSTWDAARAVQYATRMGAKLTSNSWGGGGYSQTLYNVIQAAGNAGRLFIAAAGNNGHNTDSSPHYPSSYNLNNIIAVASTDHDDNRSYFSNYGLSSVDLGAPGSYIYSTLPGNRYGYFSGTSMATPHVAGAASLLWSVNSAVSASQVKAALLASVDVIPDLQGRTVTSGRLNLLKTVNAIPKIGYASVSQGVTISPTPVMLGQNFTVSFTLKEVRGAPKTFEQVAVAVLRADNSYVYDMAMYDNVTIPANGTWSRTATSYLYTSRPPGMYKIEIRGKVAGEWFTFDTVDSGVNPKIFQVIQPDPQETTITLVSDPGTYIEETGSGAIETYQPPDWSQELRDPATGSLWIWSSYYLPYAERQYGATKTFRETFNIPANSSNIRGEILIGADNFYAIYLNGQLIVDKRTSGCNSPPGELWSCWGTQYHTFTPRIGNNELRIVVVNAPFDGDASPLIANPGGVIYRADISYQEGTPPVSKPEMHIRHGSTPIPVGYTYDFGLVEQSSHHRFVIQNFGDGPLNLTGSPMVQLNGSADFVVVAQPPTGTLAPGAEADFDITFYPSAAEIRTVTVSIPNNDADENPYTFSITGTGMLPRPTGVSATDGTYTNRVRITWNSVPGASYYRVHRGTGWPTDATPLGSWQSATTYNDYSAVPGQIYRYWVTAAKDTSGARESWYSAYDKGHVAVSVAKPDLGEGR